MKPFRQFLFENTFTEINGDYHHSERVSGHPVSINFTHHHSKEGHYHVDFLVHGTFQKKRAQFFVHRKDGPAIIHHVSKTIHHFVREKKPKNLQFYANETSKENLYGHFAKRLAAAHGGTHKSYRGESGHTVHEIDFDKPQKKGLISRMFGR